MTLTEDRVRKIFRLLDKDSEVRDQQLPDLLVLRNSTAPHVDQSFFYVTGLDSGTFEGCMLIASPNGPTTLYTSMLEELTARRSKNSGYDLQTFRDRKHLSELVRNELGNCDGKIIGINSSELTHQAFLEIKNALPNSQLVDVGYAILKARMIKDQTEILSLREAANQASLAYPRVVEILKEGITESEVAAELIYSMQKEGAGGPSFDPIVAFGSNSAEPHYSPGEEKLRRNHIILMDYGARYKRYCSDISRTLFFGSPEKKFKNIYKTVHEASEIGIEMLAPGTSTGAVHEAVAAHIDKTEFKGRFIHSTGHTIGLSVHDGGVLHPAQNITLEEGMVFTIEPGIYIPGYGGVRIEDDVLVKQSGPELITTATRELLTI